MRVKIGGWFFGQEESWQNPLSVIADAPPIGGKLGAPRAKMGGGGEEVLCRWLVENFETIFFSGFWIWFWRFFLGGGGGANEDHVSEGPFENYRGIIPMKRTRICNQPNGLGIFAGTFLFTEIRNAGMQNSPSAFRHHLQVWRYLSGCITWSTLARGLLDGERCDFFHSQKTSFFGEIDL